MKRKLFIYAINALKTTYTPEGLIATHSAFAPGACTAYSQEEAYGRAMKNCEKAYPQSEGYTSHGAAAEDMTDIIKTWIKELNL